MDRNDVFVYALCMANELGPRDLYYDPGVRLLFMMRRLLRKWNFDNLNAPFWRLYWNNAPGAVIRHGARSVELTPDRIFMLSPNTTISMRLVHSPVTHFYAHFLVNSPYNRLKGKIYSFKAERNMLETIKGLKTSEEDHLTGRIELVLVVRGLIHRLLSKVPPEHLRPLLVSPQLAKCMAFIESEARHAVSYSDLARIMGLSIRAMARRFENELGMSPLAYQRQKRIENACALLYDREKSIKQIAEETGFYDRYHFTKVFTAITGQSPARFRDVKNAFLS